METEYGIYYLIAALIVSLIANAYQWGVKRRLEHEREFLSTRLVKLATDNSILFAENEMACVRLAALSKNVDEALRAARGAPGDD